MSYTPAERETVMQCDDESGTWRITTCQSKVITRLKKANIHPVKTAEDGMHWYENVPFNRISFRAESKRVVTDEQRQAAADRLRRARENK